MTTYYIVFYESYFSTTQRIQICIEYSEKTAEPDLDQQVAEKMFFNVDLKPSKHCTLYSIANVHKTVYSDHVNGISTPFPSIVLKFWKSYSLKMCTQKLSI
jgi:hypothetical protein